MNRPLLYDPHPGQREIHEVEAKTKVLEVGRRWGKSRSALGEMMDSYIAALAHPAPESLIPPWHGWVVVPSEPQGRQTWNEMVSLISEDVLLNGRASIKLDERTITLKGSQHRPWGLIEMKSAHNPESLQTVGLDFLWITEAQDITDKAFQKVLPTRRSPGRFGYAIYEGIPALWADHWWFRVCALAERETGKEDGLFYYKHATAFDNPYLDEVQLEEIYADQDLLDEDSWKRMYLAVRSTSAGYFKNVDGCIAGDELDFPVQGARYVAGLDLGRKVDATVLSIFDAATRNVVYLRAWDMGESWPEQRETIAHLAKTWNLEDIVVDATGMGGDIFVQELEELGTPVTPFVIGSSALRTELLRGLLIAMERETVHFPPIRPLLRQLRAFQPRKLPGGGYRVEAPPGEHDDYVFSLALGLTGCDAAQGLTGQTKLRSHRYVPLQSEMKNGAMSPARRKWLDERKTDKMRKRMQRMGLAV